MVSCDAGLVFCSCPLWKKKEGYVTDWTEAVITHVPVMVVMRFQDLER